VSQGGRLSLLCVLALIGCPEQSTELDRGAPHDLTRTDVKSRDSSGLDATGDAARGEGDLWRPDDLGFSCKDCLLEQVCVHFVNSQTCQAVKSQCKYRTPGCFSPSVNPCCQCEAQVCGLWSSCTRPPACPAPKPGSFDPERECFCYSK